MGLVGVNGQGKSTLMKMLAGAVKPDRASSSSGAARASPSCRRSPSSPTGATVASRARGGAGAAARGARAHAAALARARGRHRRRAREAARQLARCPTDRAPRRLGHRARGEDAARPARGEGLGPPGRRALGRHAEARRHRPGAADPARPAHARRAHQPPRRRDGGVARGGARRPPGALLLVTHDRYFLDDLVDRIVESSPARGGSISYPGNYEA